MSRYYVFIKGQTVERYTSILEYDKKRKGYNTIDECLRYIKKEVPSISKGAVLIYDKTNKLIVDDRH